MGLVERRCVPPTERLGISRVGFRVHEHEQGAVELRRRETRVARGERAGVDQAGEDGLLQGDGAVYEYLAKERVAALILEPAYREHSVEAADSRIGEEGRVAPPYKVFDCVWLIRAVGAWIVAGQRHRSRGVEHLLDVGRLPFDERVEQLLLALEVIVE